MKHSRVGAVGVVVFVLVLAACGEEAIPAATSMPVDPESVLGGDGLPVQRPGEVYRHDPVLLSGLVALADDGCWTLDLGDGPRLVVFPPGYTKPADDGTVMVGPDGVVVESGIAVDVIGGVVPVVGFPGVPDGYWGNYLAYCGPEIQEFVVLDALEPAFMPEVLSDDELVMLARDAELSQPWGCGIGFAMSTEDQTVALVIHLTNTSDEVESPVSFPDSEWSAEVLVGKLLMAQWCDDAVESWEPQPVVAARWPLSGGLLDFTPPGNIDCQPGAEVTATLTGIKVQTSQGEIELDDLTLVNDAYGCFAG